METQNMHFEKEIEISMILIDSLYRVAFLRGYWAPGFDSTTCQCFVISLYIPTLPFKL